MMPDQEWLYVCIYSGTGDDVGILLPEVHYWAQDLPPADRWHFLRYVDMTGHHLRVRMRGTIKDVDCWYEALDQLRGQLSSIKPRMMTRVLSDPLVPIGGGRVHVDLSFYSPELEKYAGRAGMDDAEELFTTSSNMCIDERVWEWGARYRLARAVAFLRDVDRTLSDEPGDFARAVAQRWAQRMAWAGLAPHRISDQIPQILDQIDGDIPADTHTVADAHVWAARRHLLRQPSYPLDVVHMHLNRTGLNPPEEGLAAYLASYLINSRSHVMSI